MGLPAGLADDIANLLPHRRLGDEVDVGVGIGLPALALQNPARLAAAGIITRARHRFAEWNALTILAVFFQRAAGEALLIAQFYPRKIEHALLHRGRDLLPRAGHVALIQLRDHAKRDIQAVDGRRVLQLTARCVATAGAPDLEHAGADPRQQLRAGRARLDVGEIENAGARERCCHLFISLALVASGPLIPFEARFAG